MRPTSQGWFLELTHPTTGRSVTPSLLSNPTFTPAVNGLPSLRAPIRKRLTYVDDEWDNSTLEAWFEGEQAPIDQLDAVELGSGEIVLIGIGGTELRTRVTEEFRLEYPEEGAKDLVENNTSYSFDLTDPNWTTDTGQTLQDTDNGDTLTELFADPIADDTIPLTDSSGNVTTQQCCFVQEAENTSDEGGLQRGSGSDYSGDGSTQFIVFADDGDFAEWTFTNDYDIENFEFAYRGEWPSDDLMEISFSLDGTQFDSITASTLSLDWRTPDTSSIGTVEAGTHTIRIEGGSTDTGVANIDVIAPRDGQFTYTDDNSTTAGDSSGNRLDGPETHPDALEALAPRHAQAFNLTTLTLNVSMDDTGESQAIAIANDAPSENFDEGSNASSHTVDFESKGELGAIAQGRVTFSHHSPNGTRDQTPRENYAGQTLQDFTLTADIERAPMLINQRVDDRLENVLSEIAGTEFLWEFVNDNGTETVRWARPGDREASSVPDTVPELSLTKHSELIEKVTIKGSNRSVSDERFTSSNSFEDLNRDNLIPNSESVYDPDTGDSFERDTDYEIDYGDGQIRRKSGGDLTNGDTFSIDYQFETSGTHTDPNAGGSPLEIVEEIPGLTSDNAAEQVAWFLVDEFKNPRYEAEVRIPPREHIFSGIEALSLAFRDADRLPNDALPLSPRNVERTSENLVVRLGSEREFSAAIRSVRSQVAQISRRV